jgi:hypothetical protein
VSGIASAPPPDRRCKGATSSGPCKRWTAPGRDWCNAHDPDPAHQGLITRSPHEANRLRRVKNAKEKADALEQDQLRRLGLKAMTTARAERHREELLDKLFEHALGDDKRSSIQALSIIFDRTMGKVPQGNINLNASLAGGDTTQLSAALQALPAEDRLELLRQRMGLSPAPTQIADAEVMEMEQEEA